MRAFLVNNSGRLIFWITFLFLVVYFFPEQRAYYLDADIDNFKRSYLRPSLIGIGIFVCSAVLILLLINTKSFWVSIRAFVITAFFTLLFLFIFQNLLLEASLFVNRLSSRENIQRKYLSAYMDSAEHSMQNFTLYDLAAKKNISDGKLIKKFYGQRITANDTATLTFNIGILGVPYKADKFE
jgi:hypothetical protein